MASNGAEEIVANFQLRLNDAINDTKLADNPGEVRNFYADDAAFANSSGGKSANGDVYFHSRDIATAYKKLADQLIEVSHKYEAIHPTGPEAQPKYIVTEGTFHADPTAGERPYVQLLVYDEDKKKYRLLYHLIDLPAMDLESSSK